MDPLPRFLFLVTSVGIAGIATAKAPKQIQIFKILLILQLDDFFNILSLKIPNLRTHFDTKKTMSNHSTALSQKNK